MTPSPDSSLFPRAPKLSPKAAQAILVWAAGAFCIYGWDWLICLPKEYERIWKKKWNYVTVLYLANRYFGFLQFSFAISLVANAWSPQACKHVYIWRPVGALISTALSQMILGSRVYAIYAKNRTIAIALCLLLIVEVCIGGYTISMTSPGSPRSGPPGANPPCVAVPPRLGWMIEFWSLPAFYDAIVFGLTAWKTYTLWRNEINTPLLTIIWRDGIVYFFAIFSMNLANVIVFSVAPNSLVWLVNLTPTLIFTVTLSCRLVLNLRGSDAKLGVQVYSGGGRTADGNTARSRVPPMHVVDISSGRKNMAQMESSWMEDIRPSLDKSSSRCS